MPYRTRPWLLEEVVKGLEGSLAGHAAGEGHSEGWVVDDDCHFVVLPPPKQLDMEAVVRATSGAARLMGREVARCGWHFNPPFVLRGRRWSWPRVRVPGPGSA